MTCVIKPIFELCSVECRKSQEKKNWLSSQNSSKIIFNWIGPQLENLRQRRLGDVICDNSGTGIPATRVKAWLLDGYSQIFRSYVLGPSGFWTMTPLRYAAKFDTFLSLDCAPTPSTLVQFKERKGSNFAIWQPCVKVLRADSGFQACSYRKRANAINFDLF